MASQLCAWSSPAPISSASFFESSGTRLPTAAVAVQAKRQIRNSRSPSIHSRSLSQRAENRLVCHLGVVSPTSGVAVTRSQLGWSASSTDQPPFLVRKFRTISTAPRRLAVLAHGRKLQGEDAAKGFLGIRIARDKRIGALDQHKTEINGVCRQAKLTIAARDHVLPHVFEGVGEQRQGAGILDQFLGGAPGDVAGKMLGLEPSGKQLGGRLTTSRSCASRKGGTSIFRDAS